MNSELKFRNLRADEIEARIGTINNGGVELLLYKNARADQTILDETVGPLNWQRHHLRDNANCVVSIWDANKNMWIEKEDTGTESFTEKEKGIASDSFKRACFNFGIGRELYTSPKMFVPKQRLKNFKDEGGKLKCYDTFMVTNIIYEKTEDGTPLKKIASVTVALCNYGKPYDSMTFQNNNVVPISNGSQTNGTTTGTPQSAQPANGLFSDDEVILFGNCRGKKYGDAKNTPEFKSFVNWVHNSHTSYPDKNTQNQYERFKKLEVS